MKIKHITKKDLLTAGKEFEDWYGVVLPYPMLVEWSQGASYNDVHWFDTTGRELLSDFVAHKLADNRWPSYGDNDEFKKKFYTAFMKNAKRFKVKVNWQTDWWKD
jgi:hypothetical protein